MYLKEIIQAGYRNGLTEDQIKNILKSAVQKTDEERKKIWGELNKEYEKVRSNSSSTRDDRIEDDERV